VNKESIDGPEVSKPHEDEQFVGLRSHPKYFVEGQATILQLKGMEMGIFIDHALKCHCECRDEGIEYGWGCTK
jgi:hypothetical protein